MPIKTSAPYSKGYVKNLYSSGLAAQLTFGKNIQNKVTDKKLLFRQHIVNEMKNNNLVNKDQFDSGGALLNLFRLLCFIQAWSDLEEMWINADDTNYKAKRQQMKFKKAISKSQRRLIHVGLFKSVSEILLQFKQVAEVVEKNEIEGLLEELKKYELKKNTLINVIQGFLKTKGFYPASEAINEHFSSATQAISAFSVWFNKLLNGCGVGVGLIAALACGLSTGGAFFILLVSFGLSLGFVLPFSLLIFLAGTRANFQLFSQHIPQFFQDLYKDGGVTEFINQQGKRLQLSINKKFLLLPIGILSLSVGIAAAAIAYLEGTKMIAFICPMLTVTCPHLTVAVLSILAAALLVGLTIVMLRTFIGVLQSQFLWQDFKKNIQEKWQSLNVKEVFVYIFKAVVMAAAFFGLAYLDFTGTATLSGLLGWVAADVVTCTAIIGDLPFTLKTALAWCNSLFSKNNSNVNLTKDIKYYLKKTMEIFALITNAFGNGMLVFTGSPISGIASIACFMNSYASNRVQENNSELIQARTRATQNSLDSLYNSFFKTAYLDTQIPEASNEELTELSVPKRG